MLPDPLHPAVVHFPIVMSVLLPIMMVGAVLAIRRGARHRPAWLIAVAAALALTLSTWAAIRTGEAQEDRVEEVVGHSALEAHEEPAERYLLITGVLAALSAGGLAGGRAGRLMRGTAVLGSIVSLAAAVQVGRSGGELVYEHGAAAVYADEVRTDALGGEARRDE